MAGTALPPRIDDISVTLTFGLSWDGGVTVIDTGVYAGYCTIADVKFEFTNIANMPKTADVSVVAQIITQAAIDLQSMLDPYYEMPYAGTNYNILTTLRQMNTYLAAAMLIDRYLMANDVAGAAAATKAAHVTGLIHDLGRGITRWDAPFGDAVLREILPLYNVANTVSIRPDPTLSRCDKPIFTLTTRPRYRRGDSF